MTKAENIAKHVELISQPIVRFDPCLSANWCDVASIFLPHAESSKCSESGEKERLYFSADAAFFLPVRL